MLYTFYESDDSLPDLTPDVKLVLVKQTLNWLILIYCKIFGIRLCKTVNECIKKKPNQKKVHILSSSSILIDVVVFQVIKIISQNESFHSRYHK